MTYGKKVALALDQLLNALLGGWPDETLSSRCWRWHEDGVEWPRRIVNALVWWQKDHCRSAYQNEIEHKQLPEQLRSR